MGKKGYNLFRNCNNYFDGTSLQKELPVLVLQKILAYCRFSQLEFLPVRALRRLIAYLDPEDAYLIFRDLSHQKVQQILTPEISYDLVMRRLPQYRYRDLGDPKCPIEEIDLKAVEAKRQELANEKVHRPPLKEDERPNTPNFLDRQDFYSSSSSSNSNSSISSNLRWSWTPPENVDRHRSAKEVEEDLWRWMMDKMRDHPEENFIDPRYPEIADIYNDVERRNQKIHGELRRTQITSHPGYGPVCGPSGFFERYKYGNWTPYFDNNFDGSAIPVDPRVPISKSNNGSIFGSNLVQMGPDFQGPAQSGNLNLNSYGDRKRVEEVVRPFYRVEQRRGFGIYYKDEPIPYDPDTMRYPDLKHFARMAFVMAGLLDYFDKHHSGIKYKGGNYCEFNSEEERKAAESAFRAKYEWKYGDNETAKLAIVDQSMDRYSVDPYSLYVNHKFDKYDAESFTVVPKKDNN